MSADQLREGLRCEIVKVHHPVFKYLIGRHVIITRVNEGGSVWAHDDVPIKRRINRNGRKVTVYNPKMISTIYAADELQAAEDQTRRSDTEEMQ